jgi:hypothetical protein
MLPRTFKCQRGEQGIFHKRKFDDEKLRGFSQTSIVACLGLLVILHAAIGGLSWFAPRFASPLRSFEISRELGVAYVAPIHFNLGFPYVLPTDTNGATYNSELVLFENGRVLGPPHALHAEIRKHGDGRYSHWQDSIIFSSSDGSDPRTNGRDYSVASVTRLNLTSRLIVLALLLADIGILYPFRERIYGFLAKRARLILRTGAFSVITLFGLTAFGAFGTLVPAESGPPKDTALVFSVVQHACLGVVLSFCIWAAGAGVSSFALHDRRASLARVLIPALPISLLLLASLETISLVFPQGRWIAFALWAVCVFPLSYWRPPRKELFAAMNTALCIVPFSLMFGIWLGLLWHGPTETLSGSPTGDVTFYASSIWSLACHPYPHIDLGYENSGTYGYFNMLFPALGAVLIYVAGFDPFLFLLASGGSSYIVLSTLMLHLYIADRGRISRSLLSGMVLVLSILAAARYPYWVVESIPVVFVPALTIAVWWMTEQSRSDFRWTVAATAAGLTGSLLSKIVTAAVLVPLGTTCLWRQFGKLPRSLRAGALAGGGLFGVYCITMLWHFLPGYVSTANVGPESFSNPKWWFVSRDISALMLVLLAWLVADGAVALCLTIGLATFLLYSFVFQIDFVCATLLLGIMTSVRPAGVASVRLLAAVAFALALPAMMLSDPGGISSGIIWVVCLGGAALAAISGITGIWDTSSPSRLRVSAAIAIMTLLAGGLALVGIARGNIIVDSGQHFLEPALTPELRDVWLAVRRLTPPDALIFTDQVDETINVLGGWNTFAVSGQRQIYLSSYYTSFELRADSVRLREVLAINESVLNGIMRPTDVPTRSHYQNVYAVISRLRSTPATWKEIYSNRHYSVFQILP